MPHNYKQIVDAAPDAILVVAKGRFLFANAAAAALAGVPDPAALLDRHVLDLVPGESRAQILRLMAQHDSHPGTMSAIETKMLRVDGTIRDVEVMARPIVYGGSSAFYEGSSASVVFVCDISGRKRAEHELRTSEDRYRQIVESMNEALVVYDPAATIKFVNRQFCELFGYRPEDVIGKPATAVYAPETRVLVEEGIERRRHGLHDRYEAELTGISGKSVFVQVSAAPLVHDGEFAGSMALITDMSERAIAQESLRKSEQRYQEIVDSSPNYIFSFDCEDRYLAANIAARERVGLSEEEMIGRTLEEVGIPAETAEEWRAQHALVRSTRQTRTLETIAAFPIGGPRILRRTVSPIFSETGAVIGVSGWSTDITEQKISEEKTQKLLRAIEEMDEVMFTTDPDGVITYVNPAFERIYGYTSEEAIGQTARLIKSGTTPPEVYERLWRELAAGHTVTTEFLNRRRNGDLLPVVASVSPIHGPDGRLTGFTAVQRDVTVERRAEEQRRRFEQQLAHSSKMQALGTLSGGIAHDFNNILSIVLTHATIVEMSKNNPARSADAIATIKKAVQRGAGLSRQILTFARKTDVQFANVDVNHIIGEISSAVREMFPRSICTETDLDAQVPAIRADADQLHQALLNLCINARDAMSEGGTLRLGTRRVNREAIRASFPAALDCDHVCIFVSDTGHGMTRETASRIFEPFFTTKDFGKGSGLGLAVVYGIVQAHDGWIEVASEQGRGSSFELYFPASTFFERSEDRIEPQKSVESGSEKLLLIEDEPEISEALTMQLTERGYRVVPAGNAADAERALADTSNAFDIIVTDLGIPGISSRDLVRLIRAAVPNLPIIPMTGYVDPDLRKDVLAAGTQPILEKPFTIDELLGRIREAAPVRA